MKLRFLFDEHIPHVLMSAILRLDHAIDIVHVGQQGAPPKGTLDPDVLIFCEREMRALVTNNRRLMGRHIADHFNAGREHWGIFEIQTDPIDVGFIAESLHLYWSIEEAESIKNGIIYLQR